MFLLRLKISKHWYALSLRDRIVYVSTDLDIQEMSYEDLADPQFKGKLCSRSGQTHTIQV
ncbi:hypothetical protein OURE66S_02504 [Oligella ureolytica]